MENKETKQCPYCGEEILAAAKKCKYCGEWLDNIETPKNMIQCPTCGEDVEEGTMVCPHCNEPIVPKAETSITVPLETEQVKQGSPNETPTENKQVRSATIQGNSTFKDFMTKTSLAKGLLILLAVRLGIGLLNLVESPAAELISSFLDVIAGCVMSLFIIQRVAQDRSKIDLTSLFAIGSCIFWPIGMYIGSEAVNNPSFEALGYVHMDDTGEGGLTIRYFFASGMLWFSISLILDVVAKYLMWQTSKPKFKDTLLLGTVCYTLYLLFILTTKSLSETMLVLGFVIISLVLTVFYLLLLFKGANEYSELRFDKQEICEVENSAPSSSANPSASSTIISHSSTPTDNNAGQDSNADKSVDTKANPSLNYFIGGILVIIVGIGIVLLVNKVSDSTQNNVTSYEENNNDRDANQQTVNNYSESQQENYDTEDSNNSSVSEGVDWLRQYASNVQSQCPFDLGGQMTCIGCLYNYQKNQVVVDVCLNDVDGYLDDISYESYKMYLLSTFSNIAKLTTALKVAQGSICVVFHNNNDEQIANTDFSYTDF